MRAVRYLIKDTSIDYTKVFLYTCRDLTHLIKKLKKHKDFEILATEEVTLSLNQFARENRGDYDNNY